LFLQGATPITAGAVFGDGLTCLSGATTRLAVVFPVGGTAALPDAATPGSVHVLGGTVNGDVRHYQCWYRDAAPTFCSSGLFNLTPGLTVAWGS
jgi:predicted histidine transporter YuiF (NhaC family)